MSTSRFYKKLTQAEVGQTKTHEVYIRMPNDFDYEKFFNNTHIENGSVIEVNFTAPTVSKKNPAHPKQEYDYRFVFFANSNKEKRIPGLGPLFKAFEVEEGDVVCLERVGEGENVKFAVTFYNAEQVQVSPAAVVITSDSEELDPPLIETPIKDEPLQQIFFGAPGTGKSFKINEMCAEYENYRTTFHPDTDYASFVGSYKPITKKVPIYGFQGKPLEENGELILEDRIVYRYVFQSFLKAYFAAWREQQNENPQPVFLIIEEINRGNCAQIFGDIFQLLDRNEAGYSDYPIVADDDLAQELKREFADLNVSNADGINALYKGGKDVVGSVKNGARLLLPNNLYIWATMNTSDQSLFPIDSAFKRRWDWKYVKIKDNAKDYRIVFTNDNIYDWWQFVTAINEKIEGGDIQQEDKKLGYFFAKSKNGIISAERFLSKVIFFLYNDVFKDFGFDEDYFKGADGKPMTFASYFNESGEANEDQIERFLTNLGLRPIEVEGDSDNSGNDAPNGNNTKSKSGCEYILNGKTFNLISEVVREVFDSLGKQYTLPDIIQIVRPYSFNRNNYDMIVSAIPSDATNRFWQKEFTDKVGNKFYLSNQWYDSDFNRLESIVDSQVAIFPGGIKRNE